MFGLIDPELEKLGLIGYTQKAQTTYTDKPNASLSLPRLINQEKDFYITKDVKEEITYKTLILVDWPEVHTDEIFLKFLHHWLKLKRHLYIFLDNDLIKITSFEQLKIKSHFLGKPISPNAVYEKCAERNIAADDVALINHYKINEILQIIRIPTNVKRAIAFEKLKSTHTLCIEHLMYSEFTLTEVAQNLEKGSCLDFVVNKYKEVPIPTPQLESTFYLLFETDFFDSLFIGPEALNILCNQLVLKPLSLKITKLKTVNIDITSGAFVFLLKHCPSLIALEYQSHSPPSLSHAKEVSPYLKKLKSLVLYGENKFPPNFFNDCVLEELEIIAIDTDALNKKIKRYTQTDKREIVPSSYGPLVSTIKLTTLTKFTWVDYSFDTAILKSAINLNDLTVKAAYFSHRNDSGLRFPKLKTFIFQSACSEDQAIAYFLTTMKHVESLHVEHTSLQEDEVDISWDSSYSNNPVANKFPTKVSKLFIASVHIAGKEKFTTALGKALIRASSSSLTDLQYAVSEEIDLDMKRDFPHLLRLSLDYLPQSDPLDSGDIALLLKHTPLLEYFTFNEKKVGPSTRFECDFDIIPPIYLPKLKWLHGESLPLYTMARLLESSPVLEDVVFKLGSEADKDLLKDFKHAEGRNLRSFDFSYSKQVDTAYNPFTLAIGEHVRYELGVPNPTLHELPATSSLCFRNAATPTYDFPLLKQPSLLKSLVLQDLKFSLLFSLDTLQCYASVETLVLERCMFPNDALFIAFLNKFPHLKFLALEFVIINNNSENAYSTLNLPALQTLVLKFEFHYEKIINATRGLTHLQILGTPLYLGTVKKMLRNNPDLLGFTFEFCYPQISDLTPITLFEGLRQRFPKVHIKPIAAP